MWLQDTHERRIFRLELFGYLDCSLSLPLDMLENFFITNFSLTSYFMGMYIEGDMFVSSSYYFYQMIFQFIVLVRWILNLSAVLSNI